MTDHSLGYCCQKTRVMGAGCPDGRTCPYDGAYKEAMQRLSVPKVSVVTAPQPVKMPPNPKDIVGATKPQLHLVPPSAMIHMAKVFELGAKKYGPYNWRDNAINMTVYISAAMRHLVSMLDGQTIDPESGEPHAAHAAACMAIIMDAGDTGNLIDDRPKPGPAADLITKLTMKKVA